MNNKLKKLIKIGWNEFFQKQYEEFINIYNKNDYEVGRVVSIFGNCCYLNNGEKVLKGFVSKKLKDGVSENPDREMGDNFAKSLLPAVGDWVIYIEGSDNGIIRYVFKRQSKFSRNSNIPGKLDEKLIASNINIIFIVNALNYDFNPRRIERYVAATQDSNCRIQLIFNKADLCEDLESKIKQIELINGYEKYHIMTALEGKGVSTIKDEIKPGETAILIGSSGVGKSTIINHLLGDDVMKVENISNSNQKGRHTTSHRELFHLENEGMIIDCPGLRAIQLWSETNEMETLFSDVLFYMDKCKFTNCSHTVEPGCALRDAIENGDLEEGRVKNYYKMLREQKYLQNKIKRSKERRKKKKYKRSNYKNM